VKRGPEETDQLSKKLSDLRRQVARLKASERTHKQTKEVLKKRTHALGERVKELHCLYAISSLVEKQSLTLNEILDETVALIPDAWQYPDITSARINLEHQVYKTGNFRETPWMQSCEISVKGRRAGCLEVSYLKRKPVSDEGPFLTEERNLINVIAQRIGEIIVRKQDEDALKETMAKNRAFLNAIPDLIFRMHKDGTILDLRKGKAFGRHVVSARFVSRNVSSLADSHPLLTKDTVQLGLHYVGQALRAGKTQIYEQRIVSAGNVCHYEVLVTPSGDDEVLGVVRDITGRRQLERQVLEVSEWEKRRIGQDLHDSLCQQLMGVAFMGKVLEQNIAARSPEEARSAAEIVSLIDDAITQTKGLARGLYPVRLEAHGLMMALSELSQNVEKLFGISCSFVYDQPVLIRDNIMAVHLYRIIQEAVNNGIKHGRAKNIAISFSRSNGAMVLTVKNDGVSFARTLKEDTGMGISIMKYRARMIDASLDIRNVPDGGTIVVCSFKNKDDT
jgi:signal transduction histidine kinase